MKKKLIIVDISNFIFRAFYAIRSLNAPDGTPVNAVYGVLNMMLKLLSQYQPTHIFLARDSKQKSFRSEIYQEYKAHRPEPPEDLIPQFALVEELIKKMHLPALASPGYEADDIIGSAVIQWKDFFDEIFVATGDKDIMQFVDDKVKILDTMKDLILGTDDVFKKMEVRPEQIVDYLSMVGDSSDNIPGMKGIGAKGAAKLLAEYGTLENCHKNKDKITNKRVKAAFDEDYESGLLSKKLVQIATDVPLPYVNDGTLYQLKVDQDLLDFLQRLGFKSIVKKIQELPQSTVSSTDGVRSEGATATESTPELSVQKITSKKDLPQLFSFFERTKLFSFNPQIDRSDIFTAEYMGLALTSHEENFYVSGLENAEWEEVMRNLWSHAETTVIAHDVKKDLMWCQFKKIPIKAKVFDTNQAAFVVDVAAPHDLEFLSQRYLDREIPVILDPLLSQVVRAQVIRQLHEALVPKIAELKLEKIFYDIDTPLIDVLACMENIGVRINPPYFSQLEVVFRQECQSIAEAVTKVAGDPVNLNSPKQVSFLLFEKLGLPVIKRTKTGNSTDSEVLEELIERNLSEIPALILRHRELEKLTSTYVSVLPTLINPRTGRIHTTYNQNVAATGRLSSDNPNLQNIPIKTIEGKKVRKGFIAAPGKLLFSADYSQVELRLLAHFAKDQTMIEAFQQGIDIHTRTAAEVLNIPIDEVTTEYRSMAKAVNFGLMYGQSSFGLARNLGINRNQAKDYISMYFTRFSSVKGYLDSLKELAEKVGYAETFYGRKRQLPDIRSQNRTIKSVAERVAVNSPIQGTAADIIKLAMIKLHQEILDRKLHTQMIMQVHDELIFEVPEDELEIVQEMVPRVMEGVVHLSVPLKVETGVGVNWLDMK